ncbi:MAG: S8 family peptidase [Paucibacter sp.]|nr:S8 family peptidase [Roseateles sp.]
MLGMLNQAAVSLRPDIESHPLVPGVLVLKLREECVAKSHRPIELSLEAGLTSAGHARIDEMLVAGNADSLGSLATIIARRNTKVLRANLSTIEAIGAWGRDRRASLDARELRAEGRALLRPFRYADEQSTSQSLQALAALLRKLKVAFELLPQRWGVPMLALKQLDRLNDDHFDALLGFPGIRRLLQDPLVRVGSTAPTTGGRAKGPAQAFQLPLPDPQAPVVAIVDSGVSPTATILAPWVVSRDTYVLPPDTDYLHGTQVASLVAAGRLLNDGHDWFPPAGCMVHDVAAIENFAARLSDVLVRLRTAVKRRPDIKVWNLSIGGQAIDNDQFSQFAIELDALSDEFDVLFVISSGNYSETPRRGWPDEATLNDRILSPADSVRSLTVGALAHLDAADALVSSGSPAPYSRRGPGPVFTPKPDIVHVGGGVHAPWASGASSVKVLLPGNKTGRNFGTSFASPLGSAMTAHTWQALLREEGKGLTAKPSMVKALMVHAAHLTSPDYSPKERRYYGAGRPPEVLRTLYDTDDSFTLVFEANLVPGRRWRKSPFPIPAALLTEDGKFRGEIVITAVYAPPLDPNAGSEYVRANVELSFGVLDDSGHIHGRVPMEGEAGTSSYETVQIEHGGKWSPVKLHRKAFPKGCAGQNWALQAAVVLRANEPPLSKPLNVAIAVTLRALDGNPEVHSDGVRALNALNWATQTLPARVPIST